MPDRKLTSGPFLEEHIIAELTCQTDILNRWVPKKKDGPDYMPNLEGQELEDPDCVPLLEQSAAVLAQGLKIVAENQVLPNVFVMMIA